MQSGGLWQVLLVQLLGIQFGASGRHFSADDPVWVAAAHPACSAPDNSVQGFRSHLAG